MVNLSETFPPGFYRRLEQVQRTFSLVGEDVYYSGMSSAGNTPRQSEVYSIGERASTSTFFLQDSSASSRHLRALLQNIPQQPSSDNTLAGHRGDTAPNVTLNVPTIPAHRPNTLLQDHSHVEQNKDALSQPFPQQRSQHTFKQQQHTKDLHLQQQNTQIQISNSNNHRADYPDNRRGHDTSVSSNTQPTVTSHPPAPPPYDDVMKNRERLAENNIISSSQQHNQHSSHVHTPEHHQQYFQQQLEQQFQQRIHQQFQQQATGNTHGQSSKPHAHAAILKVGNDKVSHNRIGKSQFTHGLKNIEPLPNSHDKKPSHYSYPMSERSNRHDKPVLRSQHSWANPNRSSFHEDAAARGDENLALSYPLLRPRPSSATDIEQLTFEAHSENTMRQRSNSSLANNPRHGSQSARQPVVANYNQSNNHHHGKMQQIRNYEHVKDSSNYQSQNGPLSSKPNVVFRMNSQPGGTHNGHNNPKRPSSRDGVRTKEEIRSQTRAPSLVRSSKVDFSDATISTTENGSKSDVPPPPLPPKGEFLRRRASFESQVSLNSSVPGRTRQDSDPNNTTSGSSSMSARGGGRSNSRISVEIQDAADCQYLVYNPNLPVQDMLDHNQNFLKMGDRNSLTQNALSQNHRQAVSQSLDLSRAHPHIPPLELPPDLLATSDVESPDDVTLSSSNRRTSDSTFSSVGSNIKNKSLSLTKLDSHNKTNLNAKGKKHYVGVQDDAGLSQSSASVDKYPDDIYVDVPDVDVDSSGSVTSLLKVLPVQDKSKGYESDPGAVSVHYRHARPEARDIATNGDITGEVFSVTLNKVGSKLGMGLIDGLHTSLKQPGIYVRNVLPDTPAALCGAIRVGDRILAVNGKSIVGTDYQRAMLLIRSSGPRLDVLVAKCDRTVASKILASST